MVLSGTTKVLPQMFLLSSDYQFVKVVSHIFHTTPQILPVLFFNQHLVVEHENNMWRNIGAVPIHRYEEHNDPFCSEIFLPAFTLLCTHWVLSLYVIPKLLQHE